MNHFKHAREKHSGDSQRGQHAIDFRFPNPTVGINIVGGGGVGAGAGKSKTSL